MMKKIHGNLNFHMIFYITTQKYEVNPMWILTYESSEMKENFKGSMRATCLQ